jgi:hypothetical protein
MRILILFAALTFSSCGSYIQIIDTQSNNCKTESDMHYFENDSIKITYNFWELHGKMAFSVFNKTGKPLYVNWKNSSFIINGEKYDYWNEIENTQTSSLSTGYAIRGYYGVVSGVSKTSAESVTIKPEKVTFIPPKSSSKKVSFDLMPQDYFKLSKNKKETQVPYSVKSKKKTKVYVDTYTKDNTPVSFRNYIAISGTEDATSFIFIDNEFFVSEVREMSLNHFMGKAVGYENGETIFEKKEKKSLSFYLDVPNRMLASQNQ